MICMDEVITVLEESQTMLRDLAPDAFRYRWLRDPNNQGAHELFTAYAFNATPNELDAAIDAEIAKGKHLEES